MRFIVHEHRARHHHFDFRLQMGDALKSWAVPKGPSLNPAEKRLAIQVPDHPLSYGSWEGIIPEGEYGAGEVMIWDQGEYRWLSEGNPQEAWERGSLAFELRGEKLQGGFSLLRLKRGPTGKEWLLIKKRDDFARSDWQLKSILTPERIAHLKVKRPPCPVE
jgi:bifunctional non-homologous end joining protein LigD